MEVSPIEVPSSTIVLGLNLLISLYKNSACFFGAMPFFVISFIFLLLCENVFEPAPKSLIVKTVSFNNKSFL
jgi:hypothetical protein